MYELAPAARAAVHALLRAAHAGAGLEGQFVGHAWPTHIGELWSRPGLCGAFMCGWPYALAVQAGHAYTDLASVVPDWPHYQDQPTYRSELLVRAGIPWRALAESPGSSSGWTAPDTKYCRNAADAAPHTTWSGG